MNEPDLVANFDQEGARLKGVAGVLGQFFKALLEEGFNREEAMFFTANYFQDDSLGDPE